jgi:pSer/pThr/pTyr-binding forkhead associated (FHA) protein
VKAVNVASIIIVSGDSEGEFLPLGRRTSVIGRAESLPLQVLDDLVSRKHLKIRFDEGAKKYHAEDLLSKHGTFINKQKISEATVLAEGDIISIGQTQLLFTDKDFDTQESALMHYKKYGEKARVTRVE